MISHESRLSHNENGGKVLEIEWGLFFCNPISKWGESEPFHRYFEYGPLNDFRNFSYIKLLVLIMMNFVLPQVHYWLACKDFLN